MTDIKAYLKEKVSILPHSPGVYQYFDEEGTIIYVGKAKDLRKRVASYFTKNHDNRKTTILVRKIVDIKHIVVETEEDALLLENNLIKKYKPRYNVLLKDDKGYPWICVKSEPYPRVFSTRNVIKDGSLYFGPYTSTGMVRALIDLIRQLFQLRNCNLNLDQENIRQGKYKVCLEYHLGNCKAPCEGKQSEENYKESMDSIKNILKGNLQVVNQFLKEKMTEFAANLQFEEAAEMKKKMDLIEKYRHKSTIVNPKITNLDVFSISEDEKGAFVNFLRVSNGAIIQAHTMELKKRLEESKEELLIFAITEIRSRHFSIAREILVPFEIDVAFENVQFHVPIRGDKKKLMDLSERNVKYYRLEKEKQNSLRNPEQKVERVMETMRKDLRMHDQPRHIECFDNSNIQGHYPVAACVVFRDGKPAKRDYRHFNIKTVEGPDDFASMEEIIYRRYKRLTEEEQPLPQLIVIDGGKGQLGAALNALHALGLRGKISIVGIAKRLEELFFPGDPIPLYLDKNSESLRIIQHLRDEAHRFGITFHRKKRSLGFIGSELDEVKGVGDKSKDALYKTFKTMEKMKSATLDSLTAVVGANRAKLIFDHFNRDKS